MSFIVELRKERFKFSSTHFTIFSEKEAERLHGHNYKVAVNIKFKSISQDTGISIEFSELKKDIQKMCDVLDEKILIPADSPYLSIGESDMNIEVKYNEKFYSFPKEDCEILAIPNTSSECLAQWFYEEMASSLTDKSIVSYMVTIEETSGQSVTYTNYPFRISLGL